MTEAQKQKLLLPFPASDIEWRTAYTNTEKTKGFAVPFVNSRAIQERLDEIFGPENWQNEFTVRLRRLRTKNIAEVWKNIRETCFW